MIDAHDVWADALVSRLLEEGHLELASPRDKPGVVAKVAIHLEHAKIAIAALAAALVDHKGVAELTCDDETLAALVRATRPTAEHVELARRKHAASAPVADEPKPRDLSRLDPTLGLAVDGAIAYARSMGHSELTTAHVLAELLRVSAVVELARRRGGDPDGARAEAAKRIAHRGEHRGRIVPDWRLATVLDEAEEDAPRLVTVADFTIAAMRPKNGDGDPLVLRAFARKRSPSPVEAEEPDDVVIGPTPRDARGPGALDTSDDLATAFALYRGEAERHADPWRLGRSSVVSLSASLVATTERELATTLPDDFWAAAAARVPAIAALGIGSAEPHGEPAPAAELCDRVLTIAGSAEVDEDLVAFAELLDAEGATLCAKRGVGYAERNAQEVFRVDESGRRSVGTFGAYLVACAREACTGRPMPVTLRAYLRGSTEAADP